MDKDNVVYTYNRILLGLKKEGNPAFATTQMDLEDIMQSEISQTQKTNTVESHLYEKSKTSQTQRSRPWNGGCQQLEGR